MACSKGVILGEMMTQSICSCFGLLIGSFAKLRRAIISFVIAVHLSAWNISAPIGQIFMKSDI